MLTPPPLKDVVPGDPITSEGMNNLVTAVRTLYNFLNHQRGTLLVRTTSQAASGALINVAGAVVTVQPTGDTARPPRAGVFAGNGVNAYVVDQLQPGRYDVIVEAPGYNAGKQSIDMPDSGDAVSVAVALTVVEAQSPIPNLFGQQLSQAVANLKAMGFTAGRIIDSHGTDVVPAQIPDQLQALPILGQWPPAATPAARNTSVFLHVAARAEFTERVKVPSLTGLTVDDARALLEASKLELGTTVVTGPGPAPAPGPTDR